MDLLGYNPADLVTLNSDLFTHPDDISITHDYVDAFRQGKKSPPAREKRFVRKDGVLVWVRASGAVRRDAYGRANQFIAIIEDITQRKDAEEALRASEERLRQVFAQAPVAICVLRGHELLFELANPNFQRLFPGRVLLGKPLLQAVPEVSADLVRILHGVLDTGAEFAANELKVSLDRDDDGVAADYWFNMIYHPLQTVGGNVSAVVVVAVDVTCHVQARRALERANRELEEFAYVASHDFQEPLRMINIYTELLVRDLQPFLNDQTRIFAAQVSSGVRRIEQLMKDLLSFSRTILTGDEQAPARTADLNRSLASALQAVELRTREQRAVISAVALPTVRGDEAQLAQVFQNILFNALKYCRLDAPVVIQISCRQEEDEWVVSVKDNGIGFEQDQAERVFGLFKRLHKNEDDYPGTGLGLAICKSWPSVRD